METERLSEGTAFSPWPGRGWNIQDREDACGLRRFVRVARWFRHGTEDFGFTGSQRAFGRSTRGACRDLWSARRRLKGSGGKVGGTCRKSRKSQPLGVKCGASRDSARNAA